METACGSRPSDPLHIGSRTLTSRLLVGTGNYASLAVAKDVVDASGAEIITMSVRRVPLGDKTSPSIV